MKQIRKYTRPIFISVSLACWLFACVPGSNKNINEVADETTPVTSPKNDSSTRPGDELIIRLRVADFARWKKSYESNDSIRRSYGLTSYILGRGATDSNMVIAILKMADVARAKELTASQGIKKRMHEGGVIGSPSFLYFERIMVDTSTTEVKDRVLATYRVKDRDAWKTWFDTSRQARLTAGFTERGVGFSIDDNHLITIVFAVTDMRKAMEFVKEPGLKDTMAKGGVEGTPGFFFYHIVEKY